MEMIGSGTQDRVNGFFFLQHDAKIYILGATEAGHLLGIVPLDFLFYRLAAAIALIVESMEIRGLGHIADSDDLSRGLVE